MSLNNETALARLAEIGSSAIIASETAYDGVLQLETSSEHIIELLQLLRDDATLRCNFLTTLAAVHYPDQEGRELAVVYHLHNWLDNFRIRVKVFLPISNPQIPTATVLWPTANWMERQEYDFFGVNFAGHPNLVRILNVDEMEVFPLRKEFKLEDGTRTDKDDRFFGRDGNYEQRFDI